jgi:RNA polymerase sigma-70 factor (ECF subfamily)
MSYNTSHCETDCWQSLRNDDPQALSYFYDTYVDGLFITAMSITNDRELAKDALQEVFIELWTYRKSITEVKNTQAYLTRILKSVLLKKIKAGQAIVTGADFSFFAEEQLNREEAIIASDIEKDKQYRLRSAVSGLSKKQQMILKLRFHENMSYDEIADRLGMKYQSVNNLVFRTFRRLRGVMTHLFLLLLIVNFNLERSLF